MQEPEASRQPEAADPAKRQREDEGAASQDQQRERELDPPSRRDGGHPVAKRDRAARRDERAEISRGDEEPGEGEPELAPVVVARAGVRVHGCSSGARRRRRGGSLTSVTPSAGRAKRL